MSRGRGRSFEDNGEVRRHCMIVHAYYPLGETRVQRQAEALLRNGYEVDVISLKQPDEPGVDEFKSVTIYRLPVRRYKKGGQLVQLLEYLAFFFLVMVKVSRLHLEHRYDTIQAHSPPDFLVMAAWLPRLLGARLIVDLHDLMPEFYMGRFGRDAGSLPVRIVRLQERLACAFADHVITVSHHWRQALIDRGVRADKVSVVMNVADDQIFRRPEGWKDGRMAAFQSVNGNGHSLRLIYHGAIVERYGLDLALKAMARVREEAGDDRDAPEIHLTLIGRGEYMKTLIEMAKDLGLHDEIDFHWDLVPAEELPEIILESDAGIVPYRADPFTDGLLPTKLMEYAALGLPAIAARTTAIERYFGGTMVELFEPGSVDDLAEQMMRLYNDRARLDELAARAERFNRKYNWTKVGGEYVALMKRLADE
ncbi:MAG: glycosyltransferase family 4 protein [Anaerolineae bacterium]|nr:glycosyltransferase family 4 protein [Anaerolineae bacterium]